MVIIVEDINDNSPVFRPMRSSTLHLSEFAKPGTILETVEVKLQLLDFKNRLNRRRNLTTKNCSPKQAIDQDEGRFGQVTYSIEVGHFGFAFSRSPDFV